MEHEDNFLCCRACRPQRIFSLVWIAAWLAIGVVFWLVQS